MSIEKFQPTNGTVGASFIADWCGTCELGKKEPCDIAVRTMWLKVEDADYPAEWRYVDGCPVCTAHVPLGQPLPEPRCKHTMDMFEKEKLIPEIGKPFSARHPDPDCDFSHSRVRNE